MCIPENDDCPINDVKIDLTSNSNEYIPNEYKMAYINNLSGGYSLYYTNKETENNIIVKFKFTIFEPRYINEDNFIFDIDTYYGLTGSSKGGYNSYGGGGGGGGAGSGRGGFRNLISYDLNNLTDLTDSELKKYILKKIENDINIDKSLNYVSNNFYVGNYIGFKDSSHMKLYNSVFSNRSLFIKFPGFLGFYFGFLSISFLLILIICSLARYLHEDTPGEGFELKQL